ncbi:neurotrophin-3-like [Scleropages formosus]|uniref:Neurotrophin-3 n=1 Tax=Scleropages formosus TaxID=113540 RepID=A0A0P7UJC6_SCLFO|nr:neurotrophin-3-like [Scleropages formosus]
MSIIQVNLVMSILLYVMFLAYLCGIQATSMDRRKPTPDPVNSLIIRLLQTDIMRSRHRHDEMRNDQPQELLSSPQSLDYGQVVPTGLDYPERRPVSLPPALDVGAELLRQHKRYNSPRVVLSEKPPLQPPPMYLADDYVGGPEAANRTRRKRYAKHRSYRGEYSVCDSESQWVTDKTSAVDIQGRQVTVLGTIKTSTSEVKQYFYETKCMSTKRSCRGIDEKHWNSQCKTSQTYVRALTFGGWTWIRIDTSCVCALSRKRRRT